MPLRRSTLPARVSALQEIPSDIIGHHYYNQEILVSPVPIDGVHAFLPEGAGLGVELAPELVRQFS